jgi:hypothetical protein
MTQEPTPKSRTGKFLQRAFGGLGKRNPPEPPPVYIRKQPASKPAADFDPDGDEGLPPAIESDDDGTMSNWDDDDLPVSGTLTPPVIPTPTIEPTMPDNHREEWDWENVPEHIGQNLADGNRAIPPLPPEETVSPKKVRDRSNTGSKPNSTPAASTPPRTSRAVSRDETRKTPRWLDSLPYLFPKSFTRFLTVAIFGIAAMATIAFAAKTKLSFSLPQLPAFKLPAISQIHLPDIKLPHPDLANLPKPTFPKLNLPKLPGISNLTDRQTPPVADSTENLPVPATNKPMPDAIVATEPTAATTQSKPTVGEKTIKLTPEKDAENLTSPPANPQPTEIAALPAPPIRNNNIEAVKPVIPATPAMPPAVKSPETIFAETIATKLRDIGDRYPQIAIAAIKTDDAKSGLILTLAESWYLLPADSQDDIATKLVGDARRYGFDRLTLKDKMGNTLARNAVIGDGAIVLSR